MSAQEESQWKAKYRRLGEKFKKLLASNKELTQTLDENLPRLERLEEIENDLTELQGSMRAGTYREEFEKVYEKLGGDPADVDDAWELLKLDTKAETPDPKAIKAATRDFLKKKPKFLKPADDEEEEGEGDQAESSDEDDEDEDIRSVFQLAPKAKAKASDKTKTKGNAKPSLDDEEDDEPAMTRGKAAPKKPAGTQQSAKLERGEGAARGRRNDHRALTIDDVVDRDFAATGRTDAFRIG